MQSANHRLRNIVSAACLAVAGIGTAQAAITFYENDAFNGRTLAATDRVRNFERQGFDDRASSVVVTGNRWEVCEENAFQGRCVVLRPGRYASLGEIGFNDQISSARVIANNAHIADDRYAPDPVAAQRASSNVAAGAITFYEDDAFRGRTLAANDRIVNFDRQAFNDRASSVIVTSNRWEVCEDAGFQGRCVVLRPGQYPSMGELGFNDRVSSARMIAANAYVAPDRYAPEPVVQRDYRRRNGERLYDAQVTQVRAVMGQPEQRCWMEQQEVPVEQRSGVPGGIAGAVIGGILGHQIGGGRGQDLATIGGAVGGAVVGSKIATRNNNGGTRTEQVQRCTTTSEAKPSYWDVTYVFRGQAHTVQMTQPPGSTITVNGNGEPRAVNTQG